MKITGEDVAFVFYTVLLRLGDLTGREYRLPSAQRVAGADRFGLPLEDDSEDDEKEDDGNNAAPVEPSPSNGTLPSQGKGDPVLDHLDEVADSVEILRDNRLHRIWFHNHFDLREDVKKKLKWSVDRSSAAGKVRDFLMHAKQIIADYHYVESLSKSAFSRRLLGSTALWSQLLLVLTFVLNILILAVWRAPASFDVVAPEYYVDWYGSALYTLGGLHLALSTLVAATYFLLHPPSLHALAISLPWKLDLQWMPGVMDNPDRSKTSPLSPLSLHHLLLIPFSALGLLFHGYFFCYHLLHVVVGNDLLQRVMQSVTKNGRSLLWVAALMVIVIYIYSLASFAYLRKSFDEGEGAFCQNTFQCFVTSLRLGLLSGGGLGEALPTETHGFAEPGYRTFFDLSYFVLITIIGLNVVFGIIVDTFSELRDERYKIQEAMHSECFICSLGAHEFDRKGNGFENHVKKEHCMWSYLCFLLHLDAKDPTEMTSHEQVRPMARERESLAWTRCCVLFTWTRFHQQQKTMPTPTPTPSSFLIPHTSAVCF
jgi:inositol 1,4,5-triphosphate receptor type 1